MQRAKLAGLLGLSAWALFFIAGAIPPGWPEWISPGARVFGTGAVSAACYFWMLRSLRPRTHWSLSLAGAVVLAALSFFIIVLVSTVVMAAA